MKKIKKQILTQKKLMKEEKNVIMERMYEFNKEHKKSLQDNRLNNKNIKYQKQSNKGITLVALVITILFSYDEKLKCSNSKGFLLQTI